jgi:hypothetical protein
MGFKKKFDGQTDKSIQLGDKNNPVRASIEGYYIGTKDIPDSGYGPGKLHIFQTSEGSVGVWGKTNSNRLMTSDLVGQMCRLTFTGMGEKLKGKNPAYKYELEVDSSETIDTTGIDVNAKAVDEDEGEEGDTMAYEEERTPAPRAVLKAAAPAATPKLPNTGAQARIQALINSRNGKPA